MQSKQATEADRTNDDEQAIRRLVDTWLGASEGGDLTTMLSLLSDDVLLWFPVKNRLVKPDSAGTKRTMKAKR